MIVSSQELLELAREEEHGGSIIITVLLYIPTYRESNTIHTSGRINDENQTRVLKS